VFNRTYVALHKGSAIEPEVRRFLSRWAVKATASCAGPGKFILLFLQLAYALLVGTSIQFMG